MGENAIYVSLWVSGAVPDPLNWRVTRTGHAIDCVVFAVNIDDNSPRPFAAQLAFASFAYPLYQPRRARTRSANAKARMRNLTTAPYEGLVSNRTSFHAVKA